MVVLCVTIFICLSYACFGHFKYLSPYNYEVSVVLYMLCAPLSSSTLRLIMVCVLFQTKEEDNDKVDGAEEDTMVLYMLLFSFFFFF